MRTALLCVLSLAFWASSLHAQWSPVAPGIDYREFTLAGPVRVFVARADRSVKSWTIDSMKGGGELKGGRETVPDMVARYDDSITPDGRRYAIKVAINGDYYNATTGVPLAGQIVSGWFAKRFGEYSGGSGFVWTTDRRCFLGGNVQNGSAFQHVEFADQARMKIGQLNEPRAKNSLAVYTSHFAANTGTDNDGAEVIVRMESTLGVLPSPPGARGKIISVRRAAGSSPLPVAHVVLSAHGTAAVDLLQHARPDDPLLICLDLKDYGNPDIGLAAGDWRDAHAGIGGTKAVLVNGRVPRDWEAKAAKYAAQGKKHGSVVQDPRTAIAFNPQYIYFLVIDGRSKVSIGMTFTEAGNFCRDELRATDAMLQDGGGSSTLWVDGQVRNTPSGKGKDEKAGVLRAVSNGLFIAIVAPPKRSAAFQTGRTVRLKNNTELRLGPGAPFGSAGRVAGGDRGTILPDPLNGSFAKGNYWWLCRFGDLEGWAALGQFVAGS